jgi:hypothetical protein
MKLVLVTLALALLSAGCIGFEVTKRVEGESDGPFTVNVTCANEEDGIEDDSMTFDNFVNGEQTLESDEFLADFDGPTVCTLTEPETAGALNVTFECTDVPDGVSCVEGPIGVVVTFPPASSPDDFDDVGILVTNNFIPEEVPDPGEGEGAAPADAVTAQPTTTG